MKEIILIEGNIEDTFSPIIEKYGINFVFIDSEHSLDGVSSHFHIVDTRLSQSKIICFHDSVVLQYDSGDCFKL